MKKLILIAALFVVAPAFAQDKPADTPASSEQAKPAEQAKPPAQNQGPFYFVLDMQDLNAIAEGLNELVKKRADPLLQKLNAQIMNQDEIKKAAAK